MLAAARNITRNPDIDNAYLARGGYAGNEMIQNPQWTGQGGDSVSQTREGQPRWIVDTRSGDSEGHTITTMSWGKFLRDKVLDTTTEELRKVGLKVMAGMDEDLHKDIRKGVMTVDMGRGAATHAVVIIRDNTPGVDGWHYLDNEMAPWPRPRYTWGASINGIGLRDKMREQTGGAIWAVISKNSELSRHLETLRRETEVPQENILTARDKWDGVARQWKQRGIVRYWEAYRRPTRRHPERSEPGEPVAIVGLSRHWSGQVRNKMFIEHLFSKEEGKGHALRLLQGALDRWEGVMETHLIVRKEAQQQQRARRLYDFIRARECTEDRRIYPVPDGDRHQMYLVSARGHSATESGRRGGPGSTGEDRDVGGTRGLRGDDKGTPDPTPTKRDGGEPGKKEQRQWGPGRGTAEGK